MTPRKIALALVAFATLGSTARAEYGFVKPGVVTETSKSGVTKTTTTSMQGPLCKVPVPRSVHGQELKERNVETYWRTEHGLEVKRRRSFYKQEGKDDITQLGYEVVNPLRHQKGLEIDVVGGGRPVYQWVRQHTKSLYLKVEPPVSRHFGGDGRRTLKIEGRVRDFYAALLKNKGFSDQEIVERAFVLPEGDIHALLEEWASVHGFQKAGRGETVAFTGGREIAGALKLKSSCCGKEPVKDYVHLDLPREERYVGSFGRSGNVDGGPRGEFSGFTMVTTSNHAHHGELRRLAGEIL